MLAHSFCTPIFRHGQDSSGGSGGTGAQQVDSSEEEKEEDKDKEDKGQLKELPSLEGCYEAYLLEIIFSTCIFFIFGGKFRPVRMGRPLMPFSRSTTSGSPGAKSATSTATSRGSLS